MASDNERIYLVPGVSCQHCVGSITEEVEQVPGVESVIVDLASKRVKVHGESVDDNAVRAAIADAGFDIAS